MSTKIYGGFRITQPGATDFMGLQALLNELSAKITKKLRKAPPN